VQNDYDTEAAFRANPAAAVPYVRGATCVALRFSVIVNVPTVHIVANKYKYAVRQL